MNLLLKLAFAVLFVTTALTQEPPILSPPVSGTRVVSMVKPTYPPLARQAHVSGDVSLRVVIDRKGHPKKVTVLSGHPLLAKSAADAVMQWRFLPVLLNKRAIEYQDTVTITYALTGSTDVKDQQNKPLVQPKPRS